MVLDGYDLMTVENRDPLGNRVTAGIRDAAGNIIQAGTDYRVLQPRLVMDPNGNTSQVAFDTLGLVVGSAINGKPLPAPVEGDSLDGFVADLTEAELLDHLANPLANPQAILGRATARMLYDVFAYYRTRATHNPQPGCVYALTRETQTATPCPPADSSFSTHSRIRTVSGARCNARRRPKPVQSPCVTLKAKS